MRNRRSRERTKSSALPVERRRLGSGKVSSRHGGGVEAVLASLGESARALREKARTGIGEDRDRGVRGTIARTSAGTEEHAPAARERSAEATHAS